MDWMTLEATVESVRSSVQMSDHISIPQTFFNYKENRPEAWVFVYSDAEKAPLETVRNQIVSRYIETYSVLKNKMPELSEDDFVLRAFRLITTEPYRKLFAECRHGNVVFQ
jgi:hypothetical protein